MSHFDRDMIAPYFRPLTMAFVVQLDD